MTHAPDLMVSRLARRTLIGTAAAATLVRTTKAAPVSAAFPDGMTLLVAGPGGGAVDGWADWIAPSLARSLPVGTPVLKDVVGGADGVTGANQFDTRTVPDGGTAMMAPGAAAMAWLVGDPRARYDASRWIRVLAGVTSAVIVSRVPLGQIMAGTPVRIAATSPVGPELPAMLALDLLGAAWQPVFGDPDAALAQGRADAVFLHGRNVPDAAQALTAYGTSPVISLGVLDDAGRPQRDPAFADVPDAAELLARRTGNERLVTAWRATAGAAGLEMALVLPQQTPAAMVALWRRACTQAAGSVQPLAQAVAVRTLASPAGASAPDAASLLDLRRWLAERLNYRPG